MIRISINQDAALSLLPIQKQHYHIAEEQIHYFDESLELEVQISQTIQ